MRGSLTEVILREHLVGGSLESGRDCFLKVDSALVHDMSGLLAFVGFEAMGFNRVEVPLPVIFTDHNLVSMDSSSLDGQKYLHSCARRFGLCFSKAGNGICHSLYYHRLGRPGTLLLGADSHTATAGALGMLGVGVGGLDVAVALSGEPFRLKTPKVLQVCLEGRLPSGSCAKDAALELLRRLTVKGCVGWVVEYAGAGTASLSVPQRATLANMGAEMGATASLFPADAQVERFLKAQGRAEDYRPYLPEAGAEYDRRMTLDLSEVRPMVSLPGQPDRNLPVAEARRPLFSQIFIGSCTNGSYTDLARAAKILEGRKVAPETAVLVSCGSRQIYRMLMEEGYLRMFADAGARILECACGPCMGIGQAPASGATVLRTANRNYPGRSGTPDAQMYLSGAETAAASAVTGRLTSVEELMDPAVLEEIREPEIYLQDDSQFFRYEPRDLPLEYGPNIRPMPVKGPLEADIAAGVVLKAGDGVSTDDIIPPFSEALTLRPNIPALSRFLFRNLDPEFVSRAEKLGSSVIVAGEGYAQGSSREHAAIGCMYLGVRAVLAKSIHRIHRANLINFGVLPLLFQNPEDWEDIGEGDRLLVPAVAAQLRRGPRLRVVNQTRGRELAALAELSREELKILTAGGLIPYTRDRRTKGGAE